MLVEDWPVEARPVEDRPGVAHGKGERHGLAARHAIEEDCHRQGGDLPFADRAFGQPFHHEGDFVGLERLAVALLANDFLRQHQRLAARAAKKPRRIVSSMAPPCGATVLVSSCESSSPVMPAAKLVMMETAATRRR